MSVIPALKGDLPQQARSLYRQLLRTGSQFQAYNFREYAKRRTRDAFRESKDVEDPRQIQDLIQKGLKELQIIKEGGNDNVADEFFAAANYSQPVLSDRSARGRGRVSRRASLGIARGKRIQGKKTKSGIAKHTPNAPLIAKLRLLLAAPAEFPISGRIPSDIHIEPSCAGLMAPNFRQNTQTRRSNRSGYVEHDDFEERIFEDDEDPLTNQCSPGLPVRQWRQERVNITPPPPPDLTHKNDIWAHELPHGMPKDSQLLPNHTQELLRAARSGRLYKRPAPAEEEETEADPAVPEKTEKKEEDPSTKGFQVKIWKQVARNAEGPTMSYLAKRRKGTVTLSSDLPAGAAPGPTVTKATVRRIDAAGNPYTQEVTLNEGQQVDGEIISTTVVAVPIPGTSTEASATPVRRRPPPPKRKPKGPGRGRKKKLPLPPSSHPNAVNPVSAGTVQGVQVDGTQTLKPGDEASKNTDVEMADDDEGDEGEDGEDEGEEGDDDDEDGDGDGADGETSFVSRADSETKTDQMDITPPQNQAGDAAGTTLPPPSQEAPPSTNTNLSPPLLHPLHVEGSPLKQVISAQSPGSLQLDSSSQGGTPKPSTTVDGIDGIDGIDQTPHQTEPVPDIPTVEASIPDESSEANTVPAVDEDDKPDLDIEMQDATPFTDLPTETTPLPTADSPAAPTDAQKPSPEQLIDADDSVPAELPVDQGTWDEATNVEPSSEIVETGVIPSSDVQISENATKADSPANLAVPDVTEPSVEPPVAQATDSPSPNEQPISTPNLAESQDEQPTQEENAANSPDLFSGLEAALNQHGHSSSEPIPDKFEAAASPAEASSRSE
ncbi:hypothetical protein E0Z10_g9751 [Xylaria hypoxylon]|uniref:Complex 1 LYR protein domain-containing protein n=1 Tax=Xylaria hypoxylon TaxID=37992 RepID=A0A4Z0YN23_9PEZI|nr:hypothetical protein E0Z10_g9751 [Xylaria hypoxylon]